LGSAPELAGKPTALFAAFLATGIHLRGRCAAGKDHGKKVKGQGREGLAYTEKNENQRLYSQSLAAWFSVNTP